MGLLQKHISGVSKRRADGRSVIPCLLCLFDGFQSRTDPDRKSTSQAALKRAVMGFKLAFDNACKHFGENVCKQHDPVDFARALLQLLHDSSVPSSAPVVMTKTFSHTCTNGQVTVIVPEDETQAQAHPVLIVDVDVGSSLTSSPEATGPRLVDLLEALNGDVSEWGSFDYPSD